MREWLPGLRRGLVMAWQYKEATVPLNFSGNWRAGHPETREQFNRIVLTTLQQEGQEGWQADEPTDFDSMFQSQRIKTHSPLSALWSTGPIVLDSVTVRLKRLV